MCSAWMSGFGLKNSVRIGSSSLRIQQIGAHAARVEKLLELHRRQLADLLLRVVDAALLADARADLLHDLLDVHRVGAHVEISHKQLSAFSCRLSARTSSSSGASADS